MCLTHTSIQSVCMFLPQPTLQNVRFSLSFISSWHTQHTSSGSSFIRGTCCLLSAPLGYFLVSSLGVCLCPRPYANLNCIIFDISESMYDNCHSSGSYSPTLNIFNNAYIYSPSSSSLYHSLTVCTQCSSLPPPHEHETSDPISTLYFAWLLSSRTNRVGPVSFTRYILIVCAISIKFIKFYVWWSIWVEFLQE